MTFSVLGADGAGGIGMAVSSSSPAVAARCIHLRPGVGVAASQNVTDPRLGTRLLDALEQGLPAADALASVTGAEATIEHRQLCVLDVGGDGAAYSGRHALGRHGSVTGSMVVVAGNMLSSTDVLDAVADAFVAGEGDLEVRLLRAMTAGLAAGGEEGPLHSAGLAVARRAGWCETDLRVDWSESPLEDLGELLELWLPQRDDYVVRGTDPSAAPSYGVPGDL
ncbi:DUF1028 domain-containing protein [Nocardioides zeae]|uniref:DUF1028 domain-containing protein n=1 Tax=Nocardioides imazamoxiresistens TaxID=3231893 RepID=A0ABU3PWQ6_9ACTN|nr:DUF1028 domain-containing protein [Nocardioides zeae]MDT9593190.1 DUF1028 domain-containing protein [Nocardioides zeae]